MDEELVHVKESMLDSIFRLKHLTATYHAGISTEMSKHGISIAEIILMKTVKDNSLDSDSNVGISAIQKHLFISNAAISKMLSVLETKGYVMRDVNKRNRRAVLITLTPKGRETLDCIGEDIDKRMTEAISRLGQEETKQLVISINRFVDAMTGVIE